jgi:hypothetical protein
MTIHRPSPHRLPVPGWPRFRLAAQNDAAASSQPEHRTGGLCGRARHQRGVSCTAVTTFALRAIACANRSLPLWAGTATPSDLARDGWLLARPPRGRRRRNRLMPVHFAVSPVWCVTKPEKKLGTSWGRIEPPAIAASEGRKRGRWEAKPQFRPPTFRVRVQIAVGSTACMSCRKPGKPGTREAPTSASAAFWADGAPVLWGLSLYESVRRPVTRTDAPPLQAAGGGARPAQHGECPECAIWGVYAPPQCAQTVRTSRGSPIRPRESCLGG